MPSHFPRFLNLSGNPEYYKIFISLSKILLQFALKFFAAECKILNVSTSGIHFQSNLFNILTALTPFKSHFPWPNFLLSPNRKSRYFRLLWRLTENSKLVIMVVYEKVYLQASKITNTFNWKIILYNYMPYQKEGWHEYLQLSSSKCDNSRGVVKFWNLVTHPGQWLTDLSGPDQI